MRLPNKSACAASVLLAVLASLSVSYAAKKNSDVVDAGVFGIYINGKRVASEKFEITQTPTASIAKAELKLDQSKNPQTAELQLSPAGNLIRYQWNEKDQGSAVVEPKDEFLVEHVNLVTPAKTAEQPFILPTSTLILDDYFFSQRQILLWRYLATQCKMKVGDTSCSLAPAQFGVIVPRQQSAMQVNVEYKGPQKVNIKGADQDLRRFELHADGNDWIVWMDDSYKIQKIEIAADNTEVFRD